MLTKNSGVVHGENVEVTDAALANAAAAANAKDAAAALHGIGALCGLSTKIMSKQSHLRVTPVAIRRVDVTIMFTGSLRFLNVSTAASRSRVLCANRMVTAL